MNSIEYWFLDAAVEECIAISWIIPDSVGEIAINRIPLNISYDEMTNILSSLFCSGYIMAIKPCDLGEIYEVVRQENIRLNVDYLLRKGFIPSCDQIRQSLMQPFNDGIYDENNFYYFLTPLGGAEWELNSMPRWNQYIIFRGESNEINISCHDRDVITQYINYHSLLNYSNHDFYAPILNSQIWKELIPFYCTYWKKLSTGYKVSYQVECLHIPDKSFDENVILLKQRKEAISWYYDLRKWYTNIFDY